MLHHFLESEPPHCVWIKVDTKQRIKSLCAKILGLSGDVASLHTGQFKRRCFSPELISPWPWVVGPLPAKCCGYSLPWQ